MYLFLKSKDLLSQQRVYISYLVYHISSYIQGGATSPG